MAASESGNVDLRVRVARARESKKEIDSVGKSVRGLGKDVEHVDKKSRTASKGMKLFTGATNKARGAVMGLGRAAGSAALFGVGALGYEVIKATKGWSEHMAVVRRSNAVIKSTQGVAGVTANHVGKLSDALERQTGMDGDLIQSGANLLLTFTNVRNGVGKNNKVFDSATATTVNMSKALGQSTKASAIQLGKALNDPIKGVTALSKVGVSFTQQQKDQIKTLVDSGKTMDAQKIILKELGKEFPKVEATPFERLVVVLHQVEDTIGQAVLPIFDKFVRTVTPPLEHVASAASNIFSDKNLSWGEKFSKLGTSVRHWFGPLAGEMIQGLKDAKLDDKLKDVIIWAEPKMLEGFKTVGTSAPDVLWTAFTEAPLWAEAGVGTFVASKLGLTSKAFTALTDLLTGKGGAVGKIASIFGDRGSSPVNPLYVVNVGSSNKASALGKVASVLKSGAGKAAATRMLIGMGFSAAAAASFIAWLAITQGDHNNPTKGPGSQGAATPKGHVPFVPGPLTRQKGTGDHSYDRPPGGFGVGHMARGGPVRRGGMYEVGEEGRERVFLPTGAYVQPNIDKPIVLYNTTNLVVNDQVLATAVHKAAIRKASTR